MENTATSDILENLCAIENKIDIVQHDITLIKATMVIMKNRITSIEEKLVDTNDKIEGELIKECKKMGTHIDFVENVYENVKHPLGYICKKIKGITGNNTYELTNK